MWEQTNTIPVRVVAERGARPERLLAVVAADRGLVVAVGWPGEEGTAKTNGAEAPRVVVYDARTNEARSLDDLAALRRMEPQASLVVVGMRAAADFVLACVQAGASGYVVAGPTANSAQECCAAIRAVARGQGYFCPETARALVQARPATTHARLHGLQPGPIFPASVYASSHGNAPATATALTHASAATNASERLNANALTPREREILKLVAEGHSTPEIARLLAISAKTVEGHRGRIMAKLKIHNIAGLVRHAIRTGVIAA